MNERLRELMLEAGYAAPELAGRALKLSELIIRKCADIGYDAVADGNSVLDSIKEHFGVKE